MKLFIVFATITCFFLSGSLGSTVNNSADYLSNPKDDCGNVCGQINANTTDSKCGDPDKRNYSLLLIHNQLDNKEENSDYYESLQFECVEKCPHNLKIFTLGGNSFCVKDPIQFEKGIKSSKIQDNTTDIKDEKEVKNDTIEKDIQSSKIQNNTADVKDEKEVKNDTIEKDINISKIQDKTTDVKDEKEQVDDTIIMKAQNNDNDNQNGKSNYTWWIAGGSVVLAIAIISIVVIGVVLKKKSGNADFEQPSPRPIHML